MPMGHETVPNVRLVKTFNALLHARAIAQSVGEALDEAFGCGRLGHENLLEWSLTTLSRAMDL